MPLNDMMLKENERIDEVNDSLSLIQKTDGLTFGTDALLLAGYLPGGRGCALELGGGTGIISMLLLARGKIDSATTLEIQEEYAELISRNAEYNSLSERLTSLLSDVREYRSEREYDTVYTNPPYMKCNSGKACELDKKNIARHEVHGTVLDFCRAASRNLKFGGSFFAVYRTDRMMDLLSGMRECGIEPKRLTLVHADTEARPSMLLVEGKRGGKSGMLVTRPLIIYSDKSHREYTSDMNYIMDNGAFPRDYYVKGK